jgi:hypothetical protein
LVPNDSRVVSLFSYTSTQQARAKCLLLLPRRTASQPSLERRLLGFGYMVGLPVATYLTWEGRLIEGKGVSPSINVEMKPEQFLAGEDPQMQKALELAREL